MTDNKEREAVERDAYSAWVRERYMHPEHVFRDNYAWEAWQARAALAASQEKAEPVALRKTFEEWLGEVVADGGCTVEALLVGDTDPIRCARSAWDACLASLYAAPVAAQAHPDDAAVDRFAIAMKEKLAIAREKGRSGWENMDPAELSLMLRQHVEKGDPRDVANFCMFLWALGERIGDSVLPYGKRAVAAQASKPVAFEVRRADGSPLAVWEPCTRELYDATLKTGRYAGFENGPPSEVRALCVAPQPSAEAVRDAALEEAANAIFDLNASTDTFCKYNVVDLVIDAIRALKSAPPQPAEQPSASRREQDLAMAIRRIVSSARRNLDNDSNVLKLANEAWSLLVRLGLEGSPLRDAGNALPTKPGVYAWSAGTANALVLVNRRPSSHSPGGVLNGHVIESTKFYDGCPVTAWGKDGRWVLLHDFDARAQGEQA